MYNYGLRGFLIAAILTFVLFFQGCSSIVTSQFAFIFSLIPSLIAGVVGLLVGNQFKSESTPKEVILWSTYKKYILIGGISLIVLIVGVQIYRDNAVPSQKLKGNLGNLDGTWAWKSKKSESTYYLGICYDSETKSGKYDLSNIFESWEGEKPKLSSIRKGKFNLVNGYDMYGDRAYVGKDEQTGKPMFVITLLDDPYGSEWHLRISMEENNMFGQSMFKIDNDCESMSK